MEIAEIKESLDDLVPEFAATVAPVYVILNWKWEKEGKQFIPGKLQIAECLYELIDSLDPETSDNGTGGLRVYYLEPSQENEGGEYGLEFVLSKEKSYH